MTKPTWYIYPLWIVGAAVLGFAIAALFAGWLQLPRSWFLLPYVLLSGAFV